MHIFTLYIKKVRVFSTPRINSPCPKDIYNSFYIGFKRGNTKQCLGRQTYVVKLERKAKL